MKPPIACPIYSHLVHDSRHPRGVGQEDTLSGAGPWCNPRLSGDADLWRLPPAHPASVGAQPRARAGGRAHRRARDGLRPHRGGDPLGRRGIPGGGPLRRPPELAERLRATIEARAFALPDGTSLQRTGSIGFACFPFAPSQPREVGWEEVVEMADRSLYAAKRSGRNGWVGVESARAEGAAEVAAGFRADPAAAVAGGRVRVAASAGLGGMRWD